jgi:hypothetical protein
MPADSAEIGKFTTGLALAPVWLKGNQVSVPSGCLKPGQQPEMIGRCGDRRAGTKIPISTALQAA